MDEEKRENIESTENTNEPVNHENTESAKSEQTVNLTPEQEAEAAERFARYGEAAYTESSPEDAGKTENETTGAASSAAEAPHTENASTGNAAGDNGNIPHYERRKKKAKSGSGMGAKVVCLCLACALIGGAGGAGVAAAIKNSTKNTVTYQESDRDNTEVVAEKVSAGSEMSTAEIFNTYSDSVVCITVQTQSGTGAGTGFVISEDGYILTCYHVAGDATSISVTFGNDATSYAAEYVGGDETLDVAVIKISPDDGRTLKPVVLGTSSELEVGDTVTAIGNALGTLSNTTTSGIVSALDRAISMSDGTVMNLLQTDCTINSGNSGGPLFNAYGEVVGIVNAKYSGTSTGTSSGAGIEGIGFAIPIDSVKEVLEDLIQHGYVTGKPYLGISVSTVSPLTAQNYSGYVVGAYVNSVNSGSCAETAGLKVGDIITAVDNETITTSAELIEAKNKHHAGDQMTLTVYRGGESILIVVTLDEQQPETESTTDDSSSSSTDRGYNDYGYSYGYGNGDSSNGSSGSDSNDSGSSNGYSYGYGWGFPFGFYGWR